MADAMPLHDVLGRIIDAVSVDENTRHDLHAGVNDYFADDINGLDDEAKANRRAPVNRTAGTLPALFVGGLTEDQLDALAERIARRKGWTAPSNGNGNGKAIAPGAAQALPASAQQPSTTAQQPNASTLPADAQAQAAPADTAAIDSTPSADELASFRAWQAAHQPQQAQAANEPTGTAAG